MYEKKSFPGIRIDRVLQLSGNGNKIKMARRNDIRIEMNRLRVIHSVCSS